MLGAVYVQNFIKEETKSATVELSEKIRDEFVKMLKNASWLDNDTISTAVDKAIAMDFNIAYCDTHNDNPKLEKRYHGLELQPNATYLQNFLQINKFQQLDLIKLMRQPYNKDDYEAIQPISISNYYWSDTNSIGKK